jgi:hypothetical protein
MMGETPAKAEQTRGSKLGLDAKQDAAAAH